MVTEAQLSKATTILKDAGCTDVFLFGSQATGRAHSGSDVDLGVKGLPPRLFYRMHWKLEDALKMPVDLVDFDFQKDFYELLQRVGELKKIG
ncbi:MAG: nucleotidyltransferase domain-containing protein [Treponema sp.]|nr:nucleotidyltransferase domain-containing protein [Treponema sp.]